MSRADPHCQAADRTDVRPASDYEAIVKLSDGFNAADLRNVVTEAGMFAIRDDRDYIVQEDMVKAARKLTEAKSHESSADYGKNL